jgi:hypothetical protein
MTKAVNFTDEEIFSELSFTVIIRYDFESETTKQRNQESLNEVVFVTEHRELSWDWHVVSLGLTA